VAGAAGALRTLRDAGYLLVVVSNQPAAAKGLVEVEQLERVNARVVELLQAEETRLDGLHVCLHHPAGVVPELTGACTCRKPEPGLLLAAAAELGVDLQASWMVGDSDVDVAAGAAAGCRTILVEHPPSVHRRRGDAAPDARTPDLKAAAQHIVGRDRR
jgi:D-glycero-D-manno-heptose 1,7-bisphosphate phosphatase